MMLKPGLVSSQPSLKLLINMVNRLLINRLYDQGS